MLLFVSCRNKYAIIEWPLFDAPTSTHGVFTSIYFIAVLLLAFLKKVKLGPRWRKDFQGSKVKQKITKCYFLWVSAINMQSLGGHYLMRQQVPMVFSFSLSLSRCCCLDSCRNKFGLTLAQGYFKGQRSSIFFSQIATFYDCVICNRWVVTTRCAIKYPWCLYFF